MDDSRITIRTKGTDRNSKRNYSKRSYRSIQQANSPALGLSGRYSLRPGSRIQICRMDDLLQYPRNPPKYVNSISPPNRRSIRSCEQATNSKDTINGYRWRYRLAEKASLDSSFPQSILRHLTQMCTLRDDLWAGTQDWKRIRKENYSLIRHTCSSSTLVAHPQ